VHWFPKRIETDKDMKLKLEQARRIIAVALGKAAELGLKPLTVAVLDDGGALVALERTNGSSRMRPDIAMGKANGAIALGMGSRAIFKRAEEQPYFIQAMNALAKGVLVPVPGGVLIRSQDGEVLGAVGITGDSSDNDELCATAGIEAIGLVADPG
jgi:uncharacterized protein GlcG (DUF336 family)